MKAQTVHIGFEIGTGEPVSIPVRHLCITGQTQLSGKTTTLEALISRSKLPAIAFVTKRGEGAFAMAHQGDYAYNNLAPFFKHQAGWQFVSQILGAVLNEKLKFERSWIMNVSRGAKTLQQVQANTENQLLKAKGSLNISVLTTISEYFQLFMPELERLPYTSELELSPGLNVMDLSDYSTPLQMLVISSVVEEVYKHRNGVIVVIPEAWEFVPEGRSSPAKASVTSLVRKGGGLHNFVWLDSQDIAGVDKEIIRAAGVWILGVQREQNEVARTLKHIPGHIKKPKVDDIMTLGKGEFFVCFERHITKTYVQPAWMTEDIAKVVALGGCTELPSAPDRFEGYGRIPPGIPFAIDDGSPQGRQAVKEMVEALTERKSKRLSDVMMKDNRPASVIAKEREEIERMDREEKQRYEEEIRRLNEQVRRLTDQLEGALGAVKESTVDGIELASKIINAPDAKHPMPSQPFDFEDSSANQRAVVDQLFEDRIVERVLARIPTNGRI